jgi:hypothetical protein
MQDLVLGMSGPGEWAGRRTMVVTSAGAGRRCLLRDGRGDHVHRVGLADPMAACCAAPPDYPIHPNDVAQNNLKVALLRDDEAPGSPDFSGANLDLSCAQQNVLSMAKLRWLWPIFRDGLSRRAGRACAGGRVSLVRTFVFDYLDAVDVAFDGAAAAGQRESGGDGAQSLRRPLAKPRSSGTGLASALAAQAPRWRPRRRQSMSAKSRTRTQVVLIFGQRAMILVRAAWSASVTLPGRLHVTGPVPVPPNASAVANRLVMLSQWLSADTVPG